MGSIKNLVQNFSDFRGTDTTSSDLTRPINAAKEAKNFIIEQNFSLGGEKGIKLFADYFNEEPILGVHTYIYKDLNTGREIQELIALGKDLYRLKEGTFTINYTGSGSWGYDFILDEANDELRLRLYGSGGLALTSGVGTGLEDNSTGTFKLSTLESQIDGTTDFSADSNATIDAVIAAAFPLKAAYSIDSTVTSSVDIPIYYWEAVLGVTPFADTNQSTFSPYINQHDNIAIRPPVFLNNNNACYIACDGTMPLMKYDGSTVRAAGAIGLIEDDVEISAASNTPALVGTYRYYIKPLVRDAAGNFIYGRGALNGPVTSASGEAPRIFLLDNAANSRGMETDYIFILGTDSSTNTATNTVTLDAAFDETQFEFYGHERPKIGDLIYLVSNISPNPALRRITAIDRANKTISFDGPQVTPTGSGTTVCWANNYHLNTSYFTTSSSQSNVSQITYQGESNVSVGTYYYFPDEDDWFRCTAVDRSGGTITIDGIVSIPSGAYYVSAGVYEVYRTEDEGLEKFYYSQSIPMTPVGLGSGTFDTTADTALGVEYIIPDREPDYLREFPGTVAQHQDVLLTAGGAQRAGRIWYEDIQFVEGFPLVTNFYDVPSQDSGIITALWSDTYDQLAVFKDTAYLSVVGSFRDEIAILNTIANTENELGVGCQTSLLKLRNGLNIGVGNLGFIVFGGGRIDYEFTKQLNADFLSANVGNVLSENSRLRVNRVQAVNDKFKQQAYFLVPAFNVSSDVHTGANSNSKIYIIDYSEATWTTRSFNDVSGETGIVDYPFYPTAGMTVFNDRLIFASCAYDSTIGNSDHTDFNSYIFRRKDREVLIPDATDYRQDYADQHTKMEFDYRSAWLYDGTPMVDKVWHWLKVYAFDNADFVPFSLRIRTYYDWDESTAIDDTTLSFTSSTPTQLYKLQARRSTALQIRFTTSTIFQKPTMAGFEVLLGLIDDELEGVR